MLVGALLTLKGPTHRITHAGASMSKTHERAFWIGPHMIWPRRVLLNAGTWSAEQKSDYDAAWEVQKQAILGALDLQKDESNEICGQAAPNDANDTFDAYFPIAGLSAKIQYQKGLVIGLENGRDRNEGMLEEAKKNIIDMELDLIKMQEGFETEYPEHLERNKQYIFIGRVQGGKKRQREETEPVKAESVDFWEQGMLHIGSEMLSCETGV